MRKLQYTLALFFVLCLSIIPLKKAHSQNILGIGESGIMGMPDTVTLGDTISFSYYVVNEGILPTIGPIYTFQIVNGLPVPGILDSLSNPGIQPGDSALMIIGEYIFTPGTHGQGGGTTTVLVWPGPGTQDSTAQDVYLLAPVSREAPLPKLDLKIYPNPAKNWVFIQYPGENIQIDKISLYDIQGRQVMYVTGARDSLPVGRLKPGLYIIEVRAKGKAPARMKFLKE